MQGRYRGTTTYIRVLAELVTTAERRGLTTYQDIATIMGLPLTGQHMAAEIGWILGEISEDEHNAGRPMLSAVAVSVTGKPGPGFYELAKDFGRLPEGDKIAFWNEEREAVYGTWKRPLRR